MVQIEHFCLMGAEINPIQTKRLTGNGKIGKGMGADRAGNWRHMWSLKVTCDFVFIRFNNCCIHILDFEYKFLFKKIVNLEVNPSQRFRLIELYI